jgi:hypothetical protein
MLQQLSHSPTSGFAVVKKSNEREGMMQDLRIHLPTIVQK